MIEADVTISTDTRPPLLTVEVRGQKVTTSDQQQAVVALVDLAGWDVYFAQRTLDQYIAGALRAADGHPVDGRPMLYNFEDAPPEILIQALADAIMRRSYNCAAVARIVTEMATATGVYNDVAARAATLLMERELTGKTVN